jgi:uncharacterized protein HemX
MKKLLELATKVPPVVAVFLLLLALIPLGIFLFSYILKKKTAANLQHEVNVLTEEKKHAEANRMFENEEQKRNVIDAQIKNIEDELKKKELARKTLEEDLPGEAVLYYFLG